MKKPYAVEILKNYPDSQKETIDYLDEVSSKYPNARYGYVLNRNFIAVIFPTAEEAIDFIHKEKDNLPIADIVPCETPKFSGKTFHFKEK